MTARFVLTFFEGNAVSLLRKNQFDIIFIEKADDPDKCVVFCRNESFVLDLQEFFKKARRQRMRYEGIPEFLIDCATDKIIDKLGPRIVDLRYGEEDSI